MHKNNYSIQIWSASIWEKQFVHSVEKIDLTSSHADIECWTNLVRCKLAEITFGFCLHSVSRAA